MLSHLLFLPTGIEYTKLIVIFFSIVSIWVFIIRSAKSNDFILGAVNILAILLLWRLTNNINSFIISISWLLYAVSVMLFAYRRQDQKLFNHPWLSWC